MLMHQVETIEYHIQALLLICSIMHFIEKESPYLAESVLKQLYLFTEREDLTPTQIETYQHLVYRWQTMMQDKLYLSKKYKKAANQDVFYQKY